MNNRFKTWAVLLTVLVGLTGFMTACSSGSRSSSGGGGGTTPPPPPPPTAAPALAFSVGTIATNAVVATLPNQVVGLGFTLTATNGTVNVTSITVTAAGTVDETGFGAVTIVEDNNPQNGAADAAEIATPIGSVAGFGANNGSVSIPTSGLAIVPGTPRNFLVAINGAALNGSTQGGAAIVGSTVTMNIASAANIAATGSGAVTATGTFPGTTYGPVTMGVHNHLLISEVANGPGAGATSAEFIEIYNPTGQAFQLDNYHLTDVSGSQLSTADFDYWQLATAGNGQQFAPLNTAGSSDFHARFPAGTLINPGAVIVVAIDGGGFAAAFPTLPAGTQVFTIRNAQAGQTAILTWAGPIGNFTFNTTGPNTAAGLTNGGEPITLFFFDGSATSNNSDIVIDIDQVFYGAPAGANLHNNKTGIAVDGFDAGTTPTTYNAETAGAAANRTPAPTPSVIRTVWTEGTEPRNPTSNGFQGHDEMGENLGTTFTAVTTPTPGNVLP